MYITARERKILQQLISAQNEITVKTIADELDVSTRTIHRDLKGVDDALASYGLSLEKKSGSGLVLQGEQEQKRELEREINQQPAIDYTPEERHVMILSRLLEAREPVKLLSLANELGVTVATISNDLDKIEEELSGFHLTLIRKRGYGVEVQGEEVKIREAIGFLIMRHMDELELLNILRENIGGTASSTVDTVSDQLLGLVDKEKLVQIERHVEEIRSSLPYDLADSAYLGLVIHLALALERIQKDEIIEMAGEYLDELRQSQEFEMASRLISQLENSFHLTIPEAETGYITMHLMGAKVRYSQDSFLEATSLSVAFKAKQLIEYVSAQISVNLHDSSHLLNDLVIHLKPSVYRIQQKMDIQNPLTEQIEKDYKDLFAIVEEAVRQVFTEFHFPKEETAFLVMHFASALLHDTQLKGLRVLVVCSSGIGTAKILAAKLSQQFKEIDAVEHESLFDLKNIDLSMFDLVVSTVGLVEFDDYILVNPMLPVGDIHKVEHAIRRKKVIKQTEKTKAKPKLQIQDQTMKSIQDSVLSVQRYATAVHQLLDSLEVYNVSGSATEEIIQAATKKLKVRQFLTHADSVVQALMEREKAGGLGIPETKMALYHARSEEVVQPLFTINLLEKPLQVPGMDGTDMEVTTILLMLAPHSIEKEGLEVLSFLSSLIVEDPKGIKTLESHDKAAIMHYLSNKLHEFFQKN
ncbi:PRD domain-containing protein [Halobacillus sp. A5]|uniref:PRD domain-containing protein n=1 Tax=Halobacillus sp. A5 TaxID=2880263 RepID=UPI0020A6B0F1|nr:BglG family transcription antiterminator [Halobacillus sp. A5]